MSVLKSKKISETPFRLDVLEVFRESDSAVTVSFIEEKLIDFNRITLYRTMKTFVEKGIIHAITIAGSEVAYALCEEHCAAETHSHQHIHLKCSGCSSVYCVEVDSFPKIEVGNHKIQELEIQAKGICEKCLAV